MHQLLILEDEVALRQTVADYLEELGYEVKQAGTLAEFRQLFVPGQTQLCLIDLGLPDGDGMDLIGELRNHYPDLGLIVFTGDVTDQSRVSGFQLGADQYIAKPVRLDVLAATVEALLRRLSGAGLEDLWVLNGPFHKLSFGGRESISLSAQDYKVLSSIMKAEGEAVSRREIVAALGEEYLTYDMRRLDTQIRRLRKKVETAWGLTLPLNTVHSVGYKFSANVKIEE